MQLKIRMCFAAVALIIFATAGLSAAGVVDDGENTIVIRPVPDNSLLLNPGKGWVEYNNANMEFVGPSRYTKDLISVEYVRPVWCVMEPEEGKYNWGPLDAFIRKWAEQGKATAIATINFDGGMGRQYSIPKWVFDAGAEPVEALDASTPSGTITLPKTWDDPVYLAKMKKFVTAFGAHYDGNTNLTFVDIRNYGNSGECNGDYHQVKNTSLESLRTNYFLPYVQAFRKTQLILPWNGAWFHGQPADPVYAWAVAQGVGLRRDGICSRWSKDGSECLLAYGHEPVVFEYAYGWQQTVKDGYSSPQKLLNYINAGKPSYLQFCPEFFEANKDFCLRLGNKIGYHFILEQATIPVRIKPNQPFSIVWQWLNDGIAPLYEPCQISLALLDAKDDVVARTWLTESRPQSWKPGESTKETTTAKFSTVPPGIYKLAVGLYHEPTATNPGYRLGFQGRTAQGWYVLTNKMEFNP